MPPLRAISRADLIKMLRKAGFVGPESGGKHQFMIRGSQKLIVPNPHQGDITVGLLHRLLKQAGISQEEWHQLF
ncbi:MAG: type II toxin-antitoxin system HicA family toxin [Cytophagales bacterium]|nr:MAG: type II toxin-antitoxin system HicA family toxin [Cytophagales bacterium]